MKALLVLSFVFVTVLCSSQETGKFTDTRDNTVYSYKKFGNQVWMIENLRYKTDKGSGSYENNVSNDKFGLLYDNETAKAVCPEGWRLPTDQDWIELELFLGMPENETTEYTQKRGISIGAKLKSTSGWEEVNGGESFNGNNASGFNALPGGYGNFPGGGNVNYDFYSINAAAFFWTSTEFREGRTSWMRQFSASSNIIYRDAHNNENMLSVRCIKIQ